MLQKFSFATSTLLALSGIALSIFGILFEEGKPLGIGFVLIFGAGVFATLYLGTRWASKKPDQQELPG